MKGDLYGHALTTYVFCITCLFPLCSFLQKAFKGPRMKISKSASISSSPRSGTSARRSCRGRLSIGEREGERDRREGRDGCEPNWSQHSWASMTAAAAVAVAAASWWSECICGARTRGLQHRRRRCSFSNHLLTLFRRVFRWKGIVSLFLA